MDSSRKIHTILAEAQNVCAAMRVNTRWASNQNLHSENSLMNSLRTLFTVFRPDPKHKFEELDPSVFLRPFLDVICSEETRGPITAVALNSIYKFLTIGLLHDCPARSMVAIAEAVTHCRFEATDPESDEVVLMLILKVLLACLRSPQGHLLTDDVVIEMIQTCFRMSMSIQMKLSELLRKTAEHTLTEMLQIICSAVLIQKPASPSTLSASSSATVVASVPSVGNLATEAQQASSGPSTAPVPATENAQQSETAAADAAKYFVNVKGVRFQKQESDRAAKSTAPFGVMCVDRIVRFLCSLISSDRDPNNYESLRLLGLKLINNVIETGGSRFEHFPPVLETFQEDLFKFLLQNLNTENLAILTLTLRAFFNLFMTLKHHLKFQLEIFFNLLLQMMENKNCTYEKLENIVETLSEFCREPAFMVTLYVNYDCDLTCTNVFENLCKFLYQNTYPSSGGLYSVHVLALDGLLSIVDCIASRCSLSSSSAITLSQSDLAAGTALMTHLSSSASTEDLRKRKQTKNQFAAAVEVFNKPDMKGSKDAMEMLYKGALVPQGDAAALARFFRYTPGLSRANVGEFIGKRDDFHIAVLTEYVKLFDCKGMSFDAALRAFLESFRIPGEAQIISRILEIWAAHYYASNPGPFADSGVPYVLAYAAVILHVDHHHKHVKNKMELEPFIRNLRGTNGGKDLPREMLEPLYHSITSSEIIVIEDVTQYASISAARWQELIKRTNAQFVANAAAAANGVSQGLQPGGGSITNFETAQYDREIFSSIWRSVVASICSIFDNATPDDVLMTNPPAAASQTASGGSAPSTPQKITSGQQTTAKASIVLEAPPLLQKALDAFGVCARIAAHYHLCEVLDSVVVSLCKFALIEKQTPRDLLSTLAHNRKAQLALKQVFLLTRAYGDHLREGWRNVLGLVVALHRVRLLPADLLELEDIFGLANRAQQATAAKKSTGGFWGWLSGSGTAQSAPSTSSGSSVSNAPSSSSSSASGSGFDAAMFLSEPELDAVRAAVSACPIKELIASSQTLHLDSLVYMVKAVIKYSLMAAPPIISASSSSGSGAISSSSSGSSALGSTASGALQRKPSAVSSASASSGAVQTDDQIAIFGLELLTRLTLLNEERVLFLWLHVGEHFTGILAPALASSRFVEKALANFLLLCVKLMSRDQMQEHLCKSLGMLQNLDANVFVSSVDIVLKGVEKLLEQNASKIKSELGWQVVLSLLETASSVPRPGALESGIKALKTLAIAPASAPVDPTASPSSSSASFSVSANVSAVNFKYICHAIATLSSVRALDPKISVQLLELTAPLAAAIPSLLRDSTERREGFDECWLPLLQIYTQTSCDDRAEVRNVAMGYLQRTLLSPTIQSMLSPPTWKRCFDEAIFPLLNDLLKINIEKSALEETRGRAAALLSKIFLHYMLQLSLLQDFHKLWLQILRFIELYLKVDRSAEVLAETVRESLKNMILVMSAAGVFRAELWQLTWDTIGHFSPPLQAELLLKVENILPPTHLPPKYVPTSVAKATAATAPPSAPPPSSPSPSTSSSTLPVAAVEKPAPTSPSPAASASAVPPSGSPQTQPRGTPLKGSTQNFEVSKAISI